MDRSYPPLMRDVLRLPISWYYKSVSSDKSATKSEKGFEHEWAEALPYFLPSDWTIISLKSMAFTVSSTCLAFMPSSNIDRQ